MRPAAATTVAEGPQHHPDARGQETVPTQGLCPAQKHLLTQNLALGQGRGSSPCAPDDALLELRPFQMFAF